VLLGVLLSLSACSPDWGAGCPDEQSIEALGVKNDARWDRKAETLVGFDYGEPWETGYFIYGSNLALPGVLLLWLVLSLMWLRRRARAANRAGNEAKDKPLVAGSAMLHGIVRDPDGVGPTVKLSIEQVGTEERKKSNSSYSYKTRWTEVDRRLDYRSFVLETAAGRVWVEPDASLYLIDKLESQPRTGHTRMRTAVVHDGDEAFVEGTLVEVADPKAGGYRGGARGWALRPPASGHMLLSTFPLGIAYADRAANRVIAAVVIAILLFGGQAFAIPYHLARATAHDEAAVVTARCLNTHPKDDDSHYASFRLLSSGERASTRVNETDYGRMKPATVVPVSVSRTWGEPRITLGVGASTNAGVLLIPMLLHIIAFILTPILVLRAKPWWERKKINDSVGGKLESQP
jgi:hypothetical protein